MAVAMDADGSMSPEEIPQLLYFLEHGFDFVSVNHRTPDLTPELVSKAHDAGIEVHVWTADEPDDIVEQAGNAPKADQIFDKYLQALGGAQRLASLTSLVARGTYQGFDDPEKRPLEMYAKAPDERTIIVQTGNGPSTAKSTTERYSGVVTL